MLGHGTFIYNPLAAKEKYGSWEGVADAVVALGMTHAWVRGHGRNGLYYPDSNKALIAALRAKNISVFTWGWCHGGSNLDQDRENVDKCLKTFEPDGYVADIEHTVSGADWTTPKIKSFLADVRDMLPGKPLVLSTFGFIATHEPHLMKAADPFVDAFAPQVYWFKYPKQSLQNAAGANPPYQNNNAAAYAHLCLDVWRHITQKPLVLTGQAYWGESGFRQDEAEDKLAEFIAGFNRYQDIIGLNWWHLAGNDAMSAKMSQMIKAANFSARFPAAGQVLVADAAAPQPAPAPAAVAAQPQPAPAPVAAAAQPAAAPPNIFYIPVQAGVGGVPILPAGFIPNQPSMPAFVKTDGLNLRAAPRGNATVLAELTIGDPVNVLGPADARGWKQVEVKGQTGYVFGTYLRDPVHPEVEKLLAQAVGEWVFFDKGIRVDPDERKEAKTPWRQRVGEMWRSVDPDSPYDGASRYPNGKEVPWSAVYISFVIRNSGPTYKAFKFSAAHSVFSNNAIQARIQRIAEKPFWGYRISETKPALGDIVHRNREDNTYSFDHAENHSDFESHSDIVVEVRENVIRVVGGNVSDTVSMMREYELDDNGFIKRGQGTIAILKNRAEILTQMVASRDLVA